MKPKLERAASDKDLVDSPLKKSRPRLKRSLSENVRLPIEEKWKKVGTCNFLEGFLLV